MRKKLCLLLVFVFIISGFVGCNKSKKIRVNSNNITENEKDNKKIKTDDSEKTTTNDSELTKTIKSSDELFTIKIPAGWQQLTGKLNDEAIIEAGSLLENSYIAILAEPKADFTITLAEYNNLVLENTKTMASLEIITNSENATIGNYPSLYSKFYADVNGVNVAYFWNNVETNNYYIQILTWTTKSNADNAEQLLKDISNSLVINE